MNDILWRSISDATLAFSQQLDVLLRMYNRRQSRRREVSYLIILLERYKMCRLAYEEIPGLGQDTAVSVAPRDIVTKILVQGTCMRDAHTFIEHVWIDGKHLAFLLASGVVVELERLIGKITSMIVVTRDKFSLLQGELSLSPDNDAGDKADPFVWFKGKPVVVEGVDRKGKEMDPLPVFGIQVKRVGDASGKMDEYSDFVGGHD